MIELQDKDMCERQTAFEVPSNENQKNTTLSEPRSKFQSIS